MVLNSEDIIVLFEFMVTLLQYFCSKILNMIIFSLVDTVVKESTDFVLTRSSIYIVLSVILILQAL